MATFEIGCELHFINCDEFGIGFAWHRLYGADLKPGTGRGNLFFTGDERRIGDACFFTDTLINLPCQQPQGQADDTGGIGGHALDCQVGFAGIGRAKNRSYAPAACINARQVFEIPK